MKKEGSATGNPRVNVIVKYVASAVLSLIIIAYLLYHLFNGIGNGLSVSAAQLVTVNETVSVDAYIFRDEIVLYSNTVGGVNTLYQNGEVVRNGNAIADIYLGTEVESVKNQIFDIDQRIEILENSQTLGNSALVDSSSISDELNNLYYNLMANINAKNLDYVYRRKNEMITLMNKRLIAQKVVADFSAEISDLKNRKSELMGSMTKISETVKAPESGYFYAEVDGYENNFSAEKAKTLSVEEFEKLVENGPEEFSGNVVGKIATDYKWYIACIMDEADAANFVGSSSYEGIFPYSSDAEIKLTLFRVVEDTEKERSLLIFEAGDIPEDFNFLRRQTVDVVSESYTGYRVPLSAVRIVGDKKGVYILNGNIVEFKEITPLAEIDGNLIVAQQDKKNDPDYASKLSYYDNIITKGKNLYENKIAG